MADSGGLFSFDLERDGFDGIADARDYGSQLFFGNA
jgi:hypothetical protein